MVRAAVEPGVKTAFNGWMNPGEKGAGRGGGYRAPAAWAGEARTNVREPERAAAASRGLWSRQALAEVSCGRCAVGLAPGTFARVCWPLCVHFLSSG